MINEKPFISLILPSRERVNTHLKYCLESIYDNCDQNIDNFEVLVKIDFDDEETLRQINKFSKYKNLYFLVGDRGGIGWRNMNVYVDTLIKHSNGKYVFVLNDDLVMLTEKWNSVLEKVVTTEEKIYYAKNNGYPESFFIISKNIVEMLNVISPHCQSDTHLHKLFSHFGKEVYLNEIEVQHNSPEYISFADLNHVKINPDEIKDRLWHEKISLSLENVNKMNNNNSNEVLSKQIEILKKYFEQNDKK